MPQLNSGKTNHMSQKRKSFHIFCDADHGKQIQFALIFVDLHVFYQFPRQTANRCKVVQKLRLLFVSFEMGIGPIVSSFLGAIAFH